MKKSPILVTQSDLYTIDIITDHRVNLKHAEVDAHSTPLGIIRESGEPGLLGVKWTIECNEQVHDGMVLSLIVKNIKEEYECSFTV